MNLESVWVNLCNILSVHEGCGNGSMIVFTPDGQVKS